MGEKEKKAERDMKKKRQNIDNETEQNLKNQSGDNEGRVWDSEKFLKENPIKAF